MHNRLSYAGATIAAMAFVVFLFLLLLEAFTNAARAPYAGLVIFVMVPAVLLCGLALIPLGMALEWRHLRRTGRRSITRFPILDLNDTRSRNALAVFSIGSLLLLFCSVFGSFQAYEATESVAFCGSLCHGVMAPEYTTYENSPHARVRCVDCHVGPGASWYVRSKLSGTYQVYAVLFGRYPRPIPAPISSLRPAQQTCEQCHWPKQFFGGQERHLVHFLPDAHNTRWEITLLIRTGGGSPATGQTEGIHWHMNIGYRVDYIATDAMRQHIPWVRMTNLRTGTATVYTAGDQPLSAQQVARATVRRMDCMDCHNRPTHILRSPGYSVDLALDTGKIDADLPFIKRTGVQVLSAKYDSTAAALQAIERGVLAFYRQKYPAVLTQRRAEVERAIAALQRIYRENDFPAMRARWDVYPDNVGHLIFRGCYRCHDGKHRTAGGRVITRECTACHVILAQGTPPALRFASNLHGLEFQHPEDIGDAWKEMLCSECHTGGGQ